MSNSTIYVHVVVVKQQYHLDQPTTFNEAEMTVRQASRMHSLLLGQVDLIKYDLPHHINKPSRILYHDVTYLFKKYILLKVLDQKFLTNDIDELDNNILVVGNQVQRTIKYDEMSITIVTPSNFKHQYHYGPSGGHPANEPPVCHRKYHQHWSL